MTMEKVEFRSFFPIALLVISTMLQFSQPGCSPARDRGGISGLAADTTVRVFDHHVHLLSPGLVQRWKALGVPFSKPDYAYSEIDSVMKINRADRMFLLSMAYLYATDDFTDSTERRNVREENDFVLRSALKHPGRLFAFCGVNPLREYAGEEIRRCRDSGAMGLKLHFASSDVSLQDPAHLRRVRSVVGVAAGLGMPVLLHFDNQYDSFGAEDARILIDSVILPTPGLEIFLAHCGTSGGYTYKTRMILGLFGDSLKSNRELAARRIWFDISAVGLTEPAEQAAPLTPEDFADFSGQLLDLGLDRVVFGTDYPVFNTTAYLSVLEENTTLTREELVEIAWNAVPSTKGSGISRKE
jgi:predicted TIM-barrel fold metal-dependent hydrolase